MSRPSPTIPGGAVQPDTGIIPVSPIEAASGWVFGSFPSHVQPVMDATPTVALRRLEDAIAAARAELPLFVAFSGGRDSSVVLATAVHASRKVGLPDPVPITDVYPGVPESEETHWQEAVVRHLGLREWIRREVTADADLIGPEAQVLLRRFGLVWPATVLANHGFYATGAGGVLLTGEGGDNVFGPQRITPIRRLARRRRPRIEDLRWALESAWPGPIRRRALARDTERALVWLQPETRRLVSRLMARDTSAAPLHWYRAMVAAAHSRAVAIGLHNVGVIAADAGTTVVHPLLDPSFVGALAPITGRWGFPDRGDLMLTLFSGLLPHQVLARTSKARFNGVFFGPYAREFARSWDGAGVDPAFVDHEELRRQWQRPHVHGMTFLLLQQAWLGHAGSVPGRTL